MIARPLVEVRDLSVDYGTAAPVRAIEGVSLTVPRGRTLGLVGESGSGKTTLARALIGTLHVHGGRVSAGRITFDGQDLAGMDPSERRPLQGRRIGYVPQDALVSLNPVARVGNQISEVFRIHQGLGRRAAEQRAIDLLDQVGIPEPGRRARDYPHQLSGGMRQRVTIAIAIALDPDLVVADEPTTALDATIQAQIVELLGELQRQHDLALLLVSHDLGVVADLADEVAVLYAGRVVEVSGADDFFAGPSHPYSQGLLAASPRMLTGQPPVPIVGAPPSMSGLPDGCAFRLRCPIAETRCSEAVPALRASATGEVACHLAEAVTRGD